MQQHHRDSVTSSSKVVQPLQPSVLDELKSDGSFKSLVMQDLDY